MSCPVSFDELMALLDGELSASRAEELRRHAGDCPDCRRILESQTRLERAWRESFTYPSPERFREMEEKTAWRLGNLPRRRPAWLRVLPAAAAVAAVLLGVRLILLDGPPLPSVAPHPAALRPGEAGSAALPAVEEAPEELLQAPASGFRLSEDGQAEAGAGGGEASSGVAEQQEMPVGRGDPGGRVPDGSVGGVGDSSPDAGSAGLGYGSSGGGGLLAGDDADLEEERFPESLECEETDDQACFGSTDALVGGAGGGGSSPGVMGAAAGQTGAGVPVDETLSRDAAGSTLTQDGDVVSLSAIRVQQADDGVEAGASADTESWWDRLADVGETGPATSEGHAAPENAGALPAASPESLPVETCTAATGDGLFAASVSELSPVTLTLDASGMPDSLTALLLDSLFPEWSLYIPFAFRDTVLIAAPWEVRQRLAGEALPTETE